MEIILALSLAAPVVLELIAVKSNAKIRSSDHYFHIMLINEIRNNRYKFIERFSTIIGNNLAFYPQLFHWLISLFGRKNMLMAIRYSNLAVIFLHTIVLFCFFSYAYSFVAADLYLSKNEYLLYVLLLTIFTPFNFHLKNAKNGGVSARGFGVLFGQVYTFCVFIYISTASYWPLLAAVLIAFIILSSSQFASQYLVFATILATVFYGKLILLLPLIIGAIVFLIVFRKIAINFLRGQVGHKHLYYKYLAAKSILQVRYSIWRDLVYDFWRLLYQAIRGEKKLDLRYIYENSVVLLLFFFPLVPTLFFYYTIHYTKVQLPDGQWTLVVPVLIGTLLFLFTSFRKTRFLGEPERYVEFIVPFAALLAVMILPKEQLTIILVYSLMLSIVQIIIGYIANKRGSSSILLDEKKFEEPIKILLGRSDVRLLSNDNQRKKIFFPTGIKVFHYFVAYEKVGSFHFKDLFKETYTFINPDLILPLAEELNISYLFINKSVVPKGKKFWLNNDKRFVKLWENDTYLLLNYLATND